MTGNTVAFLLVALVLLTFPDNNDARLDTCTIGSFGTVNAGSSSGLSIRHPYLGVYTQIALQGLFPSRNLLLSLNDTSSDIDSNKHNKGNHLLQGGEPYIAEIKWFAFNFAMRGWSHTNGQLLSINSYQSLYSLLGTMYGGDGETTFGLPGQRSRLLIHTGSGPGLTTRSQGSKGGAETEFLTTGQLPNHAHLITLASMTCPTGTCAPPTGSDPTIQSTGSGQAVNNMSPFVTVRYIIALFGTFPSRNLLLERSDGQDDREYTLLGGGDPVIGEIAGFGGNFAPRGWADCDGQLLDIASNTALFSILGTTFGGDGRTTFGLPDLQGRVPVHPGTGPGLSRIRLGEKGGTEIFTISTNQMASHSHTVTAQGQGTPCDAASCSGSSTSTGGTSSIPLYALYTGINHVINLFGIFPSENLLLEIQNEKDPEKKANRLLQIGDGFVGEISLFGGNFAPRGTSLCDGQLLSISSNTALFSLLGTAYGGDGETTFGIPDLRGRSMVHPGQGPGLSNYNWGQSGGAQTTVMNTNALASHSHSVTAPSPLPSTNCTNVQLCDDPSTNPPDCCDPAHPCTTGEGDCNANTDCEGAILCGRNNCADPPFARSSDCCD